MLDVTLFKYPNSVTSISDEAANLPFESVTTTLLAVKLLDTAEDAAPVILSCFVESNSLIAPTKFDFSVVVKLSKSPTLVCKSSISCWNVSSAKAHSEGLVVVVGRSSNGTNFTFNVVHQFFAF